MAEEDFHHKYVSHHIIFVWFLSLLLLDWDLFRDQTVCGHHHIIICKSEEQRRKTKIKIIQNNKMRVSLVLLKGFICPVGSVHVFESVSGPLTL